MRKSFLLIIYIASLAFTPQGLKAGLAPVDFKMPGSNVTALTVKPSQYACKFDCPCENDFYSAGFNFEDDENTKSKPVNAAGLFWLQADNRAIVQSNPPKYIFSFRPLFSFNLLKLIRVLRL